MRFIRFIAFHALMTFRGLVLFFCKLLAGLFLLTFFALLAFGKVVNAGIEFTFLSLVMAVAFGALSWAYDALILKLKPADTDLILYR